MSEGGRQLGFLEKAIRLIPGYKGYKRKEERRDNDQLFRSMLIRRLDNLRTVLRESTAGLKGPGALRSVSGFERVVKRLEKVRDEIRLADRGYRGWFDMHKVRENELDKLYEFDVGLVEDVEVLEKAIQGFTQKVGAEGDFDRAVQEVVDILQRFSEKLASRRDLMVDLEKNAPVD
jgi:hypothetical protein